MYIKHRETHRINRIGWLRAAVLGANDGIISTASLLIGVAAAHTSLTGILITGVAGLLAGALSMAAGEYISVSSQADVEKATLQREKYELENDWHNEVHELTAIYVHRGLAQDLAQEVAKQLMEKDALIAHARDELGITDLSTAQPLQAACASACSFTLGAILPIFVVIIFAHYFLISSLAISSVIFLGLLGCVAAKIGGANLFLGALRVMIWGVVAMVISAGIGSLLGVSL